MGKGKSSATSATRKKHAKKHAPPPEEPAPKTKKDKKARGKKEPRQKIYIPPVKPAPVQPDPLETTGLAHSLPAELLVVLRSFKKKAEVTKIHALEELQAGWVDKCGEDETVEYNVVEMLPVWLHHVPALFLHPSRRVRSLTATLHSSLLQIASAKEQIFFFLRETASTSQLESLLGSWCVAANDVDKAVGNAAMKSWKEAMAEFKPDEAAQAALLEFVQRTALDPAGIYAYLNPVQPSFTPTPSQSNSRKGSGRNTPAVQPRKDNPEQVLRSKLEDNEENEEDRKARLRYGALGALRWMLESLETLPEGLLSLFGNPAFLTSLQPKRTVPWLDMDTFGYGQPTVRKNMWALLLTLLSQRKGQLQDVASELARAILRSAFIETDSTVQSVMRYPLLLFLKEFPNAWELEVQANRDDGGDDGEESENEDETEPKPSASAAPSAAYQEFLQFLQLGCSGSPVEGYPTVIIILSTISSSIIAASSPSPLDDLFSSFWAALDGRALSSLNKAASSAAFLSSLFECMTLVLKRLKSTSLEADVLAKLLNSRDTSTEGDDGDVHSFSKKLLQEQLGRMWQEVLDGKLKITEDQAAKTIIKTIDGLKDVDPDLSEAAWNNLSSSILASALAHPTLVARLVKELQNSASDLEGWDDRLNSVIARLADQSLEGFIPSLSAQNETDKSAKKKQDLLTALLTTFKQTLFSASEGFRQQVDAVISDQTQVYDILRSSPAVFIAVLGCRGFDEAGVRISQEAWKAVLGKLADQAVPKVEVQRQLKALVDAARTGNLPQYLRVYESEEGDGALDDFVGRSVAEVVGGRGDGVDLLRVVLKHHGFFISKSAVLGIFESLCKSLKGEIKSAFDDPFFLPSDSGRNGTIPWSALETLISLVVSTYEVLLASPHASSIASVVDSIAPDAFLFAYLLPLCENITDAGDQPSFDLAKRIWKVWLKDAMDSNKGEEMVKSRASRGLKEVREKLTGFILGTKTRVLPQTVLTLLLSPGASRDGKPGSDGFFFSIHPEFSTDTILEFLPGIAELDALLAFVLPNVSPNASMGVLEPLVPPSTAYPHSMPVRVQSTIPVSAENSQFSEGRYGVGGLDVTGYDRYGYSAYARAVSALVSVFARDRATLKSREGVEMLKHAGSLEIFAWDALCMPSSLGSPGGPQKVFGESVPLREDEWEGEGGAGKEVWSLVELIMKIEQVSAYAFLAAGGREPWKRYVVESLAGATAKVPPTNPDAPTLDERGNFLIGGIKKTMHATMNLLSWFILDSIARSVQIEVDLKAGVAVLANVDGEGSAKDQARGMKNKAVLKARMLRRVLERVFDNDEDNDRDDGSGMSKEEVDAWVGYARRIEKIAPLTFSTILATLTSLGLDSPRLDRARNEFAASLLGVSPAKANTDGLELVRVLGLCAPNDDYDDDEYSARIVTVNNGVSLGGKALTRRGGSDVIMLPVQRAVNVVKACQTWVEGQQKAGGESGEDESDEEEGPSEDLESAMLAVFVGLAPILQNVTGKHWDFMWDVVETVVENSTLEDESALLGLSHALRFVKVMEELVKTNKQLNTEWSSRRISVLGNVRDLLLEEDTDDVGEGNALKRNSVPRSVCRELILSIVQSLPDQLIDHGTLAKMCHLVADPSIEVQRLSYGMLKKAAEKRTEWVVIEVGVGSMGGEDEGDSSGQANPLVNDVADEAAQTPTPAAVVVAKDEKAERKVGRRKDGRRRKRREVVAKDEGPSLLPKELLAIIQRDEEVDLFAWMLGWMLVFDLFKDASFKVKSMYIEQLRNLDLIGQRLLPVIVHLLRLDEGTTKAVKVELWAVDEFHIAYYDPLSAPALAAHLYYRALLSTPSLISTWVSACKDRQLSTAITTLTSTHFSPLIIRTELAHLKSPEGLSELSGEGLSVKVIGGGGSGVGGEVVAAYSVDEHQLELRLRIPSDWPLHKIEVRDEKRVGVDENRWRAWVLGVQQTIWTHNGRIVDGLSLWKKNVIGHFEGQVECAICYSIISASDGSLPKKPCKTCKNRFHAGCLFKWFNTSHSSSCPLCRSNII